MTWLIFYSEHNVERCLLYQIICKEQRDKSFQLSSRTFGNFTSWVRSFDVLALMESQLITSFFSLIDRPQFFANALPQCSRIWIKHSWQGNLYSFPLFINPNANISSAVQYVQSSLQLSTYHCLSTKLFGKLSLAGTATLNTSSSLTEEFNAHNIPTEFTKKGNDWIAIFNPKVKRVLDVTLVHTLMHDRFVYTCYLVNGRLTVPFLIVSCAVSGSRRMGNIWLLVVTARHKYMTRRRVRKLGEYFSCAFSSFYHFRHFFPMIYTFN